MEENLSAIPDGGTLRRIEGDLEIIRRRKHEPIDLESLNPQQLIAKTGRIHGSKFTSAWGLEQLVNWTEQVVVEAGWRRQPGQKREMLHQFDKPVGVSEGEVVYTIKVVNPDGIYIHAYPARS